MKVVNHYIFKDENGNFQDIYEAEGNKWFITVYSYGADGILKETKEINAERAKQILNI